MSDLGTFEQTRLAEAVRLGEEDVRRIYYEWGDRRSRHGYHRWLHSPSCVYHAVAYARDEAKFWAAHCAESGVECDWDEDTAVVRVLRKMLRHAPARQAVAILAELERRGIR